MPLRKAKGRETEYKPEKTIDEMLRRVEELYEQISRIVMPHDHIGSAQYLVEQAHADLCEIAGIEREGE